MVSIKHIYGFRSNPNQYCFVIQQNCVLCSAGECCQQHTNELWRPRLTFRGSIHWACFARRTSVQKCLPVCPQGKKQTGKTITLDLFFSNIQPAVWWCEQTCAASFVADLQHALHKLVIKRTNKRSFCQASFVILSSALSVVDLTCPFCIFDQPSSLQEGCLC